MRLILAIVLFCILLAGPASAERRVALVVGNDRYDELSADEQLHNAVNDARAVKAALELLKFEVDIGENLDRKQFIEKLSDFGGRLQDGDIAFFFYAGHGVSFSGANYLLPRDIPTPRANARDEESRLADLAVAETRVVERMRAAGARVAVVVLDACRDNPLAAPGSRSIGGERGLQPPPSTRGVLTIYSAGVGQKATDLGEGNSLFTGVLVKALTTPGLGLRDVAFKTQGEVAALASERGLVQEPGVYSQIIGDDLYLAGAAATVPAPDYTLAKLIETAGPEALATLIPSLPGGPLKERARARAEALKGVDANVISRDEIDNYIEGHPEKFDKRQIFRIEQVSFTQVKDMDALAAATKDVKTIDEVEAKLNQLGIKYVRGPTDLDGASMPARILKALQERKPDDIFFIRSKNNASFFKVTSVADKALTGDEAQQLAKRELASEIAKKTAEDAPQRPTLSK